MANEQVRVNCVGHSLALIEVSDKLRLNLFILCKQFLVVMDSKAVALVYPLGRTLLCSCDVTY